MTQNPEFSQDQGQLFAQSGQPHHKGVTIVSTLAKLMPGPLRPAAIIAGSRDFQDYDLLYRTLAKYQRIGRIIHGGAPGADRLAGRYANDANLPLTVMPADWLRQGPAAGPIRNNQMAAVGDCLFAFWDGSSPGTKSMINAAMVRHLPTVIILYRS